MTRDDIIRMAREVGLPDSVAAHPGVQQLVRAAVSSQREEMRERCAKECNEQAEMHKKIMNWDCAEGCEDCAAAIRALEVKP